MQPLYHILPPVQRQIIRATFDPTNSPLRIFVALQLQNDLPPGDRKRI
jgi:hypothetical protein